MITKVCENCGNEFETEYDYHHLCYPCWYDQTNEQYMCHGTTKAGKRCRAIAGDWGYCFQHRDQNPKLQRPQEKPIAVSHDWLRDITETELRREDYACPECGKFSMPVNGGSTCWRCAKGNRCQAETPHGKERRCTMQAPEGRDYCGHHEATSEQAERIVELTEILYKGDFGMSREQYYQFAKSASRQLARERIRDLERDIANLKEQETNEPK